MMLFLIIKNAEELDSVLNPEGLAATAGPAGAVRYVVDHKGRNPCDMFIALCHTMSKLPFGTLVFNVFEQTIAVADEHPQSTFRLLHGTRNLLPRTPRSYREHVQSLVVLEEHCVLSVPLLCLWSAF